MSTAIHALIGIKHQIVDLCQERASALIEETVTGAFDKTTAKVDSGVPEIGPIPEGWRAVRLKFVTDISSATVDTTFDDTHDQKPYITASQIEPGTGILTKRITVAEQRSSRQPPSWANSAQNLQIARAGSVLYSRIAPHLPRAWLATEDCAHNQSVCALMPKAGVEAAWLVWALQANVFRQSAHPDPNGNAISLERIADLHVILPPPEMQRGLVTRLEARLLANRQYAELAPAVSLQMVDAAALDAGEGSCSLEM